MHYIIKLALGASFLALLQTSFSAKSISPDAQTDTLPKSVTFPDDLSVTYFAGPEVTPSPACLGVSPGGDVFVGVDKMGSLGKKPNLGAIVRLTDQDRDGKMDSHTVFAQVDNPRGVLPIGDQVFVLHTTFSKETGIATGMDLVVFEDKDANGVADEPEKVLLQGISSPKFLQDRGTDHASNGIRMGIDGWIYAAIGDFGFYNATDRDGTKLTMHGGGIIRMRPDGRGMEMYTHGTRNIYDVAIDPLMNTFTRDNTNDGGGWNIRFSHQIQSGEYGYPLLFKNFTEEILPALVDLGGGSGTGALYMDEPSWPAKYNQVPMMADWGNNFVYLHHVMPDGPTFTQKDEKFIGLPQVTDLDVDGSGQMYMSAWDGAGYSGNPKKGFVVRVVPREWTYKAFPDLRKLSISELGNLLTSNSAVARLHAQQELLKRTETAQVQSMTRESMANKTLSPAARVAALYTYTQSAGADAIKELVALAGDETMREYALRALADQKVSREQVPLQPFVSGLSDASPRVRAASIIALGRLGKQEAVALLLKTPVPPSFTAPPKGKEGPHATPNPSIVLPHLAVRSLVDLNATTASVNAISGPNGKLALWALRYMHNKSAVNGLLAAYRKTTSAVLKKSIFETLCRLYKTETPYTGTTWWSTRPDGHGPYYNPTEWEMSPVIKSFVLAESRKATTASNKSSFTDLNEKFQMDISELGSQAQLVVKAEKKIDLEAIKNKKGQIGNTSIEDVMLALAKIPGEVTKGRVIFKQQGCVACHSLSKSEVQKGPFMGQIGSIMTREQIAESVLKPNASISQGFATVLLTLKGDKMLMGFVTSESATKLVMRDIAGQVTSVNKADIVKRKEQETSMMPAGLANALSLEEFASLVSFLSRQK